MTLVLLRIKLTYFSFYISESLGRAVRALTISLCNPNLEDSPNDLDKDRNSLERDAVAASATALRWLLNNGLKQQHAEGAGLCISTLIGIIDLAQPKILEALLADVIYALLTAMSNLEPAAFSYLAVRMESNSTEYEDLARLRVQASQSSPLALAVRKCIDLVPKTKNKKYQEAVVPALENAIRKSSGLNTRTAAAEAVITLCHTCPDMFRSSTSSNSLLRCFFEAVFKERSGKVGQDKMNSAFGSLSALCGGTVVRSLANTACERYKFAHGNNDDLFTRQAAAMVLRSVAVKASNQFADPGNSDVWCKKVLPLAFLGMRDSDSSVSSLWRECWEDGGAAVDLTVSSNDDDGNTLDEKLLFGLTKECTAALGDVSWKLRVTGANAIKDLVERGILAPPPRRLNGDSSFDSPTRAIKRATASCLALTSLVKLIDRPRIWTGKNEVVKAAVTLATVWVHSEQTSATILGGDNSLYPMLLGSPSSDNDLFLGDSRFAGSADSFNGQTEESDFEGDDPMQTTDEEGSSVCIVGLSRLLLEQSFPTKGVLRSVAEEDVLPYRSNVLQSLELLLRSLPDGDWGIPVKRRILPNIAPKLFGVFGDESTKEAPLIVTRTLSCFGANFYHKMSFANDETNYLDVSSLSLLFLHHVDYSKQQAWTVREAAARCCARMAQCADVDTYRSRYISRLVDVGSIAVKDRKFWKVRLAGLLVLQSIVLRADKTESTQEETLEEKQLILEAVLPYKETIQGIAKRMLNDTESAVTALSTKILSSLSTWP